MRESESQLPIGLSGVLPGLGMDAAVAGVQYELRGAAGGKLGRSAAGQSLLVLDRVRTDRESPYRRAMPRLIHLNGPSRVGKSTLARRYANEHPGTLALDLDVLAGLIGGWRENFSAALETARGHGRELAVRHLRSGHDVILPQLVTVHDRDSDPAFEEAARAAGATYVQVALMVDDEEHLQRLVDNRPGTEVEARVQAALVDPESDLVDKIRGHLNAYLAQRPHTIRIDTTGLGEDTSYQRLLQALDAG